MSKTKEIKKFKKLEKDPPKNFTRLQREIFNLLLYVSFKNWSLADLYAKQWNFINYAIIGGIGVGINFLINWSLLPTLPWYVANMIAILGAMLWNWMNSVGALCEYWGYTKNE